LKGAAMANDIVSTVSNLFESMPRFLWWLRRKLFNRKNSVIALIVQVVLLASLILLGQIDYLFSVPDSIFSFLYYFISIFFFMLMPFTLLSIIPSSSASLFLRSPQFRERYLDAIKRGNPASWFLWSEVLDSCLDKKDDEADKQ
jgi:hypothetical protein